MFYTAHYPTYPLSQFIDCFWHVSGTTPYIREKVLPSKTIELMFNLGAPHNVYANSETNQPIRYKDSWVSGLQLGYILMEAVAETNIYGVRFKPGGAYPFFNFPIAKLRNNIIEMDLIWGSFVHEIRERLFGAPDIETRFNILETLMLQRLRANLYGLEAIQCTVEKMTQMGGFITTKTLSEQIGMSQKHLIGQFNKMIGVTPKQLARILKFNHVLRAIDPQSAINWTEIAHRCHYYDQAHFSKDFIAFTGFNPTTYLQLRRQFWHSGVTREINANFVPVLW